MKPSEQIHTKKPKRQLLLFVVIIAILFAYINYLFFAQDTIGMTQRYKSQLSIVWVVSWFLPFFEYWLVSSYLKIRRAEKDGKL